MPNWLDYLNSSDIKHSNVISFTQRTPFDVLEYTPQQYAIGNFFRVYKANVDNQTYIIKAFRKDLRAYLNNNVTVPLHFSLLDHVLKITGRHLKPSKLSIQLHLAEKQILQTYLGQSLLPTIEDIKAIWSKLGYHLNAQTEDIFEKIKERPTNLLPNEWTIVCSQNGEFQLYLIQEFIQGQTLSKKAPNALPKETKINLIEFLSRALLMTQKTGLVADTSPAHLLANPNTWFWTNNNMLIDPKNQIPYYIDTWWLWQTQRGRLYNFLFLDKILINTQKTALKQLLETLN